MFAKTNKRPIPGLRHDQAGLMPSIIGPDMVIRGDFKSGGELHVSGTVEGNIEVKALTVAKDATIRGEIAAEQVRVCGAVTGDIRAHEVVLMAGARVQGDVSHDVLSIEPGATLEGRCRRRDDPSDTVPAALPGAGRTAPAPVDAPVGATPAGKLPEPVRVPVEAPKLVARAAVP